MVAGLQEHRWSQYTSYSRTTWLTRVCQFAGKHRLLLKAGTGLRRDIPSRPATKMRDENSAVKYTNTLLPSDIYASAHYFSCDRLSLYAPRPNRQTQRIAAKQRVWLRGTSLPAL